LASGNLQRLDDPEGNHHEEGIDGNTADDEIYNENL
jgi:hypothetical protein